MFCMLLSISLACPPMKDDGNILLALTTRESTLVGGHERGRDRLLARSLLLSSTSPCKMAAMKFRSRGSLTRRFLLSKRYLAYCLPIQLTFRKVCIRERFRIHSTPPIDIYPCKQIYQCSKSSQN